MQALQLTKDHRNKLLEMIKILFPEYTTRYFRVDSKSSIIYPTDGKIDNNILRIGKWGVLDLSIHWFEFCMTHLLNKIWDSYPKYDSKHVYSGLAITDKNGIKLKSDLYRECFKNHPVDYLYTEFQKLNKPVKKLCHYH